mgnify:CR=1 FL=1
MLVISEELQILMKKNIDFRVNVPYFLKLKHSVAVCVCESSPKQVTSLKTFPSV